MPDQEALEVALEDLSDVSESEPSKVEQNDETQEPEAASAAPEEQGDAAEEKETRSQRRRRLRKERESKMSEQMQSLEAENERLRKLAEATRAPDRGQFQSDAEYAAELAVHRVREESVSRDSERLKTEHADTQKQEQQVFSEALQDFVAEGSERYEDFSDLTQKSPDKGGPTITTIMAEAMLESDKGVDVAYYLGKNPKEATEISKLSPMAQARGIYALEAKASAALQPPQSKAPKPVKPVRGGASAVKKSPNEMSMSEYAAYRQKQLNGEA